MMAEEEKIGKRVPKWAVVLSILIPSVSSAAAAWYSLIKGDPEAKDRVDTTYKTMRIGVNRLTEAYNKLHLRVVAFQAREEGATAGALQAKLDDLQNKYDRLIVQQTKAPAAQVKVLEGLLAQERKLRRREVQTLQGAKEAKSTKKMKTLPSKPPWEADL